MFHNFFDVKKYFEEKNPASLTFLAKFCCKVFAFFSFLCFLEKHVKTKDFNKHMECQHPSAGQNIQHRRKNKADREGSFSDTEPQY